MQDRTALPAHLPCPIHMARCPGSPAPRACGPRPDPVPDTKRRPPRPLQRGASILEGRGRLGAAAPSATATPRRTPPRSARQGSASPLPQACGVRCAVCGVWVLCARHAMHPAHYPTQHGTRTPWCKATPHAATGNGNRQPATGNRQPASIYQRLGRCESHRFHRPVVGKSNSSLTVMVRSNISSTICGPETFDKHDPDIDTNF